MQIKGKILLTKAPKADGLSAERFVRLLHIQPPQVVHPNGRLDLHEMVPQNVLGELLHAERIEAPIDWMPALEGVVRGD